MNPEAQRIAIAEACGWKSIKRCSRNLVCSANGVTFKGTKDPISANYAREYELIPNYLHDLNAMHEAQKLLDITKVEDYCFYIVRIVRHSLVIDDYEFINPIRLAVYATAAQRAEAFLRTIGKWEDGK